MKKALLFLWARILTEAYVMAEGTSKKAVPEQIRSSDSEDLENDSDSDPCDGSSGGPGGIPG